MSAFFDVVDKVMTHNNKKFSWVSGVPSTQGQSSFLADASKSTARSEPDDEDQLLKFGDTISLYVEVDPEQPHLFDSTNGMSDVTGSDEADVEGGGLAQGIHHGSLIDGEEAGRENRVYTAASASTDAGTSSSSQQTSSQQQQHHHESKLQQQLHENEPTHGFLSANGIVEKSCGVTMAMASSDGSNVKVDSFKECLFVVHTVNQYSASKQLKKALEQHNLESFDYHLGKAYRSGGVSQQDTSTLGSGMRSIHRSTVTRGQENSSSMQMTVSKNAEQVELTEEVKLRLMQLSVKVETERQNNQLEAERSIGKHVRYGQIVQLLHVKSGCFLTVARESAEMQKDCMKLTLDDVGTSASYFALQSFFRFKQEGEHIRLGDRVRVWSRKFNQQIHVSPLKYPHNDRREVNMSTSRGKSTQWRIRLYSNATDSRNHDVLKAGDIIRLYHKELEGYFSVMSTRARDTVHIIQNVGGSTLETVKHVTGNMWEIENEDPSNGGVVLWSRGYRLKNLATGKYLCTTPITSETSTKFSATEDSTSVTQSSASEWQAYSDTDSDTISDTSFISDVTSLGSSSSSSSSSRNASEKNLAILRDKLNNPKKHFQSIINASVRRKMRESAPVKDMTAKGRWNFIRTKLSHISAPSQQQRLQQQNDDAISVQDLLSGKVTCSLTVTDSHDQATIFCLYSATGTQGPVSYDSYFRIKHRDSSTWIHGGRKRHVLKSHKQKLNMPALASLILSINNVQCVPFMNDEDVFSLTVVPKEEVNDLLYVQVLLPVLVEFENRLAKREPVTHEAINTVVQALTNLILFCTDSKEKNPFRREGIPYENRQRVLRERHTIDILMRIIQLPFEHGYAPLDTVRGPRFKHMIKVVRLCYRLIKQICKNNTSNGVFMAQYLGVLQAHLEHSLSEEALLEILDQNVELLAQITPEQVQFFINNVKKERSPQSIEFLSTICSCDDKPVVKNQDMICSLLFEDPEARRVLVLPKLGVDKKIILSLNNDDDVDLINYAENSTLGRVEYQSTYLESPMRPHMASMRNNARFVLAFFQQSILLMARLCLGRNQKSIAMIKKMLNYELVIIAIKSEELPAKLRSAFCDLMLHCYIDDTPFEKRPILNLTVKWNEVGSQIEAARMRSFKDLMFFMRKYFTRNQVLDIKYVSKNRFLLTLVRLCRYLFEFNIYQDIREIGAITNCLFQILDGRTDQMDGASMQNSVRYGESEANIIIIQIKLEVCRIMQLIMYIRTDRRLTKFLIYYKHQYANFDKEKFKKDDPHRARVLQELFNDSRFMRLSALDEILLDLTRYENNDLATTSLDLLFRSNMQKEKLASILPNVELLISPSMIKSYDLLNRASSKFRRLLRYRMTDEDLRRTKKVLASMIDDLRKNGNRSQRLLRNLGVNSLCLGMLEKSFSKRTIEQEVHEICLSLLCEFVRDNSENQKLLFTQMDFLIKLLTQRKIDTSNLLYEIVKGNRTLCPMVEEKHIRAYVDVVVEHGRQAHYLHFLRALLIVHGQPIKRNQILVTNELMDRRDDVIVVFSKKHELQERNDLIMMQDHIIHRNGKLNYYINLLYLLTDCAEGRVDVAEVKLQALLSVNEIVNQLLDPFTVAAIRDPLLKFLDEVFINTEKHNTQIKSSERIWLLFDKMDREIDSFLKGRTVVTADQILPADILESQTSTQRTRGTQTSAWTVARQLATNVNQRDRANATNTPRESASEAAEQQPIIISDHYIFNLIIPFIQHYFRRHFSLLDGISADKREIVMDMMKKLIKTYHKTANPRQRKIVAKCLREISVSDVPVDVIASCREFIRDTSTAPDIAVNLTQKVALLEEEDEAICKSYVLLVSKVERKLLEMSDFAMVAEKYKESPKAILRTLINILRQNLSLGYSEQRITVSVNSLRMLLEMLNVQESQEERKAMLNKLLSANVCEAVLELLLSPEKDIVKDSLQLGIALLGSADMKAVQDRMIRTMKENKESRFLAALRDRIRRATAEIKERRSFFKRKAERLKALREAHQSKTSDLSTDIAVVEKEEFIETGNIQYVLRFLQLLCEGHNLELQDYLREQPESSVSVNLISETLQYVFSVEKYINESNVSIAIQAFDTLTEYVQGPCCGNQLILGNAKLFFAVNEILQLDPYKHEDMQKISLTKLLELKYKISLTLISLLEGSENSKAICDLMKSTLSISTLLKNMRDAAEACTNRKKTATLQVINVQLADQRLFNPGEQQPSAAQLYEDIKRNSEQLGLSLYFLIHQMIDNEKLDTAHRIEPMLNDTITAAPSGLFSNFERKTGRIEVLREEKIERVYFEIPDECTQLSFKAKDAFVKNCPRDSAQVKVRALYDQVNSFRVEMEHHTEEMKNRVWGRVYTFIQNNWTRFKFFGFIFSVIINLLVLFFFRNQFNTMDGPIPIPGESNIDDMVMYGQYSYNWVWLIMQVLGTVQLVITAILFFTYCWFKLFLNIKLGFVDQLGKRGKWEDLPRGAWFWLQCLRNLLKEHYFYFILVYLDISILGLAISPLLYSLHLLEVVVRFPLLYDVIRAVQDNFKPLFVTAVLMVFCLFGFSNIYFLFFSNDFVLNFDDGRGPLRLCDTSVTCFFAIFTFSRGEGYWEDSDVGGPGDEVLRYFVDMLFFFIIAMALSQMVFGIVLDAFADLRYAAEERNYLIKNRCFICDIERSRFEAKANEGITFEKHIHDDHLMWNYVYFLVYLYKKEATELTGTEQYLWNLTERDDIRFFPVLRSAILEANEE